MPTPAVTHPRPAPSGFRPGTVVVVAGNVKVVFPTRVWTTPMPVPTMVVRTASDAVSGAGGTLAAAEA